MVPRPCILTAFRKNVRHSRTYAIRKNVRHSRTYAIFDDLVLLDLRLGLHGPIAVVVRRRGLLLVRRVVVVRIADLGARLTANHGSTEQSKHDQSDKALHKCSSPAGHARRKTI